MARIRKFSLGNHEYKVIYVKTLYGNNDEGEIFGRANAKKNIVEIATHINGEKLAEDVISHTIHHELSHLIMILLNEWELNSNEMFIDTMGGFFAQFNKTKR